ncbi:Ger(x)C family spore germination protein [Peribacillus sp. SCS-155]|uniref:Ger(x)C family spore germination protein n=1 Tax=Peribacillus sedimenti TaxID=3115297 RepID=UPI003906062A
MTSRLILKTRLLCAMILPFLSCLFLFGCWDNREINALAIIVGAAIDKQDNKIKLSVQVFVPRTAGGGQQSAGGSGGSEPKVLVRSGIGDNLADAVANLQQKVPRDIFWGHCDIFIFGEKLAKDGKLMQQQFDYLNRHPQPRERAKLFLSQGQAFKVLELQPPLEKDIGDVLKKLSNLEITQEITMKDFEQMAVNESQATIMPVISILPSKKKETIPFLTGVAIFREFKMIGIIKGDAARGLWFVLNKVEEPTITGKNKKGGIISAKILKQKTKLSPLIHNGDWTMSIDVTSDAMLTQNGAMADIMKPRISRQLEKYVEEDIKTSIKMAMAQVKNNMHADVFGFGEKFHQEYPRQWHRLEDNWNDFLPNVSVKINANIHLREPGLMTIPNELIQKGRTE